MSKRDRAARAKKAAESESTGTGEIDAGKTDLSKASSDVDDAADIEAADVDDADTEEAADEASEIRRPSGKRSARRRSGTVSDTDDDGDSGSSVAVKERKKKASASESQNPFVRLWVFLKQVVAELKKVIWPTRSEMITYTIVVLIFVIVMTAFISGIDLGFAKAVLWLFG